MGAMHFLWSLPLGRWLWGFDPPGRNPITIYVIAEFLWPLIDPFARYKREVPDRVYPWDAFEHLLGRAVGEAAAPWVQVSLYMAAFWVLSYVLYRKKIFIRI